MIAIAAFGGTLFMITPSAPRQALFAYVEARTTDQHFANCAAARAAGQQNIPLWDPSYRAHMDRDGDGLACEGSVSPNLIADREPRA